MHHHVILKTGVTCVAIVALSTIAVAAQRESTPAPVQPLSAPSLGSRSSSLMPQSVTTPTPQSRKHKQEDMSSGEGSSKRSKPEQKDQGGVPSSSSSLTASALPNIGTTPSPAAVFSSSSAALHLSASSLSSLSSLSQSNVVPVIAFSSSSSAVSDASNLRTPSAQVLGSNALRVEPTLNTLDIVGVLAFIRNAQAMIEQSVRLASEVLFSGLSLGTQERRFVAFLETRGYL